MFKRRFCFASLKIDHHHIQRIAFIVVGASPFSAFPVNIPLTAETIA